MQGEQKRRQLVSLVETSSDLIGLAAIDGRILYFNDACLQLLGLTSLEEARQKSLFDLIPPESLYIAQQQMLPALQAKGRWEGDWYYCNCKTGQSVPVSKKVTLIKDAQTGLPIAFATVSRDLPERLRAETELRLSESRFRRLASAGIIGVIRWDLDRSLILDANDEFLRMTGYNRDDLASEKLNFRAMTPLEWSARNEMGIRELRIKGTGEAYEKEYFRKDGSRVPVIIAGVRFEDATSEGMSFALDITEQKLAKDALKETDRRKDHFIALLAHELRNPLAPIRNGLQVMQLAGGDVTIVEKARSMMDRHLMHMVRLIDDLLDVSRIGLNKMELRRSQILLSDVVGIAVEAARPLIATAGHELTVALPNEPVYLNADLTRLAQVFSNLLTNSAKYTESGGRIWLSAELQQGDLSVCIRDNGIGIPAASLITIFDMFSQVDRSIERSTGGLGIGLALMKGLVEMHGGTVTADSEGLGHGSTFSVRLPVIPRPEESVNLVQPEVQQTPSGPPRRILVVDVNEDGAESLALMLRLLGNEVRTARDGVEAVVGTEQFRPDIVLMDVGMPRLNGLDATRQIRMQPWGLGMAIIALTGWGQDGDKERSREAGCDGHLVKPVNLSDLERVLMKTTLMND